MTSHTQLYPDHDDPMGPKVYFASMILLFAAIWFAIFIRGN